MRNKPSFIIHTGLVLLLVSCSNSSKSNSEYVPATDYPTTEIDEVDRRGEYGEHPDVEKEGTLDIGNIQLTGDIVQCNKCMGYGMVQDGMYGQPEVCKFCWISTYMRIQQGWIGFDGRYGQVDAVFNTLPANYFDGLDWNDSGGNNTEQIELEIAMHEENIAQLEHQLEYIEGSINRTQIQQQIIEEQYEIRRLKAILNSM